MTKMSRKLKNFIKCKNEYKLRMLIFAHLTYTYPQMCILITITKVRENMRFLQAPIVFLLNAVPVKMRDLQADIIFLLNADVRGIDRFFLFFIAVEREMCL